MAKLSKSKVKPTAPARFSTLRSLATLSPKDRDKVLGSLTPEQLIELRWDWGFWARDNQLPPETDWRVWLILAGRGFGKTRTGAEYIRQRVASGEARHIALVGRTAADVRDVMVTGPSGLLSVYPPSEVPEYEPSKRRVTWPCGAVAITYSAEKSDQLRGPQHDTAWCDELAAWQYPGETWDQMMFGLRFGDPRVIVTTTPRPIQIIRDLVKSRHTATTRGSTFDNRQNLAEAFFEQMLDKYQGTSIGRQELYAEILDELPGALWARSSIDSSRVAEAPAMARIVVAVDPAITSKDTSDETGILVCGAGLDGDFYVLEDASGRMSVDTWGRRVVDCYDRWKADRVVAEVNQGGDLVESMLRQSGRNLSYRGVHASRAKHSRAEPVAARYEQGKVHHVGVFADLEDQLCTYSQFSKYSPDRLDALVWGITDLDTRKAINISIDAGANYAPKVWI
jgi:phage terminase large subunit-like protein